MLRFFLSTDTPLSHAHISQAFTVITYPKIHSARFTGSGQGSLGCCGTFCSTDPPPALAVRSMRPENGGGRPGFGTPITISHRIGVVICPLAGRKGNGVSYTLLQRRKSQKQRLQHNSASRAALSPHEWDARLLACGAAGRATSADPMVHDNDRSVG